MLEKLFNYVTDRIANPKKTTEEVDGYHYAVKQDGTLGDVIRKPAPLSKPTLELKSLTSFVGAVTADIDEFSGDKCAVLVDNYDTVQLVSLDADEFGRRHVYVEATNEEEVEFPFGTYQLPEAFLMALQNSFLPTENVIALQRVASGLSSESVVSTQDDGLSQKIEVKQGANTRASVDLPPRIELFAYRTFREVDPTAGQFMLRLAAKPNELPKIALIDVTAGKWKYDTMQLVASYLRQRLPEKLTVLA